MCVVLNNVEHVSQQLNSLHSSLHWREVCDQMASQYDRPHLAGSSYTTLENLVQDTQKTVRAKSRSLVMKVVAKLTTDMERFLKGDFISNPTAAKVLLNLLFIAIFKSLLQVLDIFLVCP